MGGRPGTDAAGGGLAAQTHARGFPYLRGRILRHPATHTAPPPGQERYAHVDNLRHADLGVGRVAAHSGHSVGGRLLPGMQHRLHWRFSHVKCRTIHSQQRGTGNSGCFHAPKRRECGHPLPFLHPSVATPARRRDDNIPDTLFCSSGRLLHSIHPGGTGRSW